MKTLRPSVLKKIHSLKSEKGKMVAVEPTTGKWFIGVTRVEAIKKGLEEFPDGIFHIMRIGYKVSGVMKSEKFTE
ncbi:MAG: hypothetical protein A3H98_14240 [Bacteroidetes bacterium RIFCSPLOWO2_02_FULL_36_8]|nr:MAG: hypothetical protein A3H98_14240 [Bacteroidetes bacterium RIFCSPLOWO2_02_FULL_36_8]OFY69125.1 MAG: hypothetical protein A3G23_06140 [Bacteroidetes bacterium RIFCSPLOWO2_12_FULL_37_12]